PSLHEFHDRAAFLISEGVVCPALIRRFPGDGDFVGFRSHNGGATPMFTFRLDISVRNRVLPKIDASLKLREFRITAHVFSGCPPFAATRAAQRMTTILNAKR